MTRPVSRLSFAFLCCLTVLIYPALARADGQISGGPPDFSISWSAHLSTSDAYVGQTVQLSGNETAYFSNFVGSPVTFVTIDWGDGQYSQQGTHALSFDYVIDHTYSQVGSYHVTVLGEGYVWLMPPVRPDGSQDFPYEAYFWHPLDDVGYVSVTDNNSTAPIPEPETYAMMLAGLGLMGLTARRRRQKLNS